MSFYITLCYRKNIVVLQLLWNGVWKERNITKLIYSEKTDNLLNPKRIKQLWENFNVCIAHKWWQNFIMQCIGDYKESLYLHYAVHYRSHAELHFGQECLSMWLKIHVFPFHRLPQRGHAWAPDSWSRTRLCCSLSPPTKKFVNINNPVSGLNLCFVYSQINFIFQSRHQGYFKIISQSYMYSDGQ